MKMWMACVAVLMVGSVVMGDDATDLSQKDFLKRVADEDDMVILDVRSADEYKDGRVPGAKHISHDELGDRLKELEHAKDKDIIIYCHSGRRAGMAAALLKKNGFTRLFHLDGDWKAWTKADQNIEK